MLQQMRALSKSWVSTLFLLALALSFGVWGIADIFRGNIDTNVATIGPTQISSELFTREYRNLIRAESQETRTEITPEQARKMGLGTVALERIINRSAIDNEATGLGLTASDAAVSAQIRGMPVFNGPLGGFDRATFQNTLQQRGYGEQEFVEIVRGDMARDQLIGPLGIGFEIPPGYVHALFAYATELRAAEYVVLTPQALGPVAPPSDAVLAAYVKAHPELFSTPEYRALTYAEIGPEDVSSGLKIGDDQLHQAYDDQKAVYNVPEKRDIEQMIFPKEADAIAASAKIAAGTSFEAVAQARGQTPTDISLGTLVAADLDKDRSAAAFALSANGVSQPIKGSFGWVLLHVTKITSGSSKSFDEAKPELTKALTTQLAQGKMVDIVNVFTDAVSGGANIAAAAKKAGMHSFHVVAVDARGLTSDGTKATVPASPDFLAQVFNADIGDTGDPFQSKDGRYYAIAVEGVTPPKVKPLDSVRAEATQKWIAEQSIKRLKDQAAAMAAQARSAGSLSAIAQKLGAPVQSGPALTRRSQSDLMSPETIAAIFNAAPNGIVFGPMAKGNGFVIARVTGILHPPLSPLDPNFQRGIHDIETQIGQDFSVALANAGRAKQGVKINQKLLDQALGGEGS